MEEKRAITLNDFNKLVALIESSDPRTKLPDSASQVYEALKSARIFQQQDISVNVITMNSRALLKELFSKREVEIAITYPEDAAPRERKVSVFSPIGSALIGKQAGDVVSWDTPEGMGRFVILKITYQPEAVGDYTS